MIVEYKVSEAKRLFWVCRLFGHWFRWTQVNNNIADLRGECRICLARRGLDVVWPRPGGVN